VFEDPSIGKIRLLRFNKGKALGKISILLKNELEGSVSAWNTFAVFWDMTTYSLVDRHIYQTI
jgi:hypothetical protein